MDKISNELINKIIDLKKQGNSLKLISKELKIGIATVSKYVKEFKVEDKSKHYVNDEDKIKIIELYKEIKDITKVHNQFNFISRVTVYSIIKNSGFYHIQPILSPEEWKKKRSLNVINWKKEAKRKLVEYKGGKCQVCNYNKCLRALDFHHLDPSKKDFSISSNSLSFEAMKLEADKCALLCANCHREVHDGILVL